MNDKLKSCPFCGSKKIYEQVSSIKTTYCGECSSESFSDIWNHRPREEKLKECIVRLIKAIGDSHDENISRKQVNAKFKSVVADIQKELGIVKAK